MALLVSSLEMLLKAEVTRLNRVELYVPNQVLWRPPPEVCAASQVVALAEYVAASVTACRSWVCRLEEQPWKVIVTEAAAVLTVVVVFAMAAPDVLAELRMPVAVRMIPRSA